MGGAGRRNGREEGIEKNRRRVKENRNRRKRNRYDNGWIYTDWVMGGGGRRDGRNKE